MSDHWCEQAACKGMDTDNWFDETEDSFAKMVCRSCPVMEACREDAIRHHLKGVWGGTTEAERETIRRKRRTPDPSKRKSHCARNHPFTPENTYESPDGNRKCRVCARDRRRERDAQRPPAPPKPIETHCIRNHEWRPETTYVDPTGRRVCRLCRQENARARREARRVSHR